jgi:ATP-binding cassette, subfamily B, bacterial
VAFLIAAIAGLHGGLSGVIDAYGRANRALRLFDHFVTISTGAGDLPDGSAVAGPLRRGIELRDVWFRYDEDHPWILRGVSFTIPYGQSVGLVGLNGAGKSTLAKLLCRFYDPQRGQILWDGVDLRELNVTSLRQRVAATYQDHMAFDLTAAESIGLGDLPAMSDLTRIQTAAELAEVHHTISALPQGYHTMLSSFLSGASKERGVLLSGGQAQRVAVARSLLRDGADLLILDEPSTGLDAVAEHRIHVMLSERRRGHTTVMVSHRLSALREADTIVVLADGAVVEQGCHDDLIGAGRGYAGLFALQAAGYRSTRADAADLAASGPAEVLLRESLLGGAR